MKARHWAERNPLDLAVAKGLRKRGYSYDVIARELGVSRGTIIYALDPARRAQKNARTAAAGRAARAEKALRAKEHNAGLVSLWVREPGFNPGTGDEK